MQINERRRSRLYRAGSPRTILAMDTLTQRPPPAFLLAFAASTLVMNLFWEYAQCQPFFVHGAAPANLAGLLSASSGDVILAAAIYAGTALVVRDAGWALRRWTALTWISVLGLSAALAIAIEIVALKTGRWGYTGLAPLVPGFQVSWIPIWQQTASRAGKPRSGPPGLSPRPEELT